MIAHPAASYHRLPWPIVLGHRGSRTVAPENTVAAIAAAADARADGVEVDVRPCGSGELVVAHDDSLERVTGGRDRRAVSALSLRELQRVELDGGGSIPPLCEVLALCRERALCINVELKRDVPSRRRAVAAAARSLRSFDSGLTMVVSSFDPVMLAAFRAIAARVPTALIVGEKGVSSYLGLAPRHLGAVAVHPHRQLVTAERVRRWHARGLRVLAWTVNDVDEARALVGLGVDGIISDDPALARNAINGK